jgi:hypothetical protein
MLAADGLLLLRCASTGREGWIRHGMETERGDGKMERGRIVGLTIEDWNVKGTVVGDSD